MTENLKPTSAPDFQSPAVTFAREAALEPSAKAIEEFEAGLAGRMLSHATLLAKSTVAYLVALAALYGVAWWLFGKDLAFLMESARPWPQVLTIVLPLLIVGIPLSLEVSSHRRRRKLEALAVSTDQYKPGFFRLEPYEEGDRANFTRADGAHDRIRDWLLDSTRPPFRYLSGASGAGKTSLLQAAVLPALREKGWITLNLRACENGIERLSELLRRDRSIWRAPPEVKNVRELLERASVVLRRSERHLLLVIDQFEETYILESEASLGRVSEEKANQDSVNRQAFLELLKSLGERPVDGLVVLISMRKDYEDTVVERYSLPPFRQNENRRSIELFDVPAAMSFLRKSGSAASDGILNDILRGAGRIEDREGLFRPVLLNLLGLQLMRSQGTLPCEPDRIVAYYLRKSFSRPSLRDGAKPLLSLLVSEQGTVRVRSVDELAKGTSKNRLEVKGILRILRDDGLVRPLDQGEEVWQVGHDFLARQIDLQLGRLGRGWRQMAGPWIAPLLLAALVGLAMAVPWWSKTQAHAELRKVATIRGDDEGLAVDYPSGDLKKIANAMRVVNAKHLRVKAPRDSPLDLGPIEEFTTLVSLDLSGSHIDDFTPLMSLVNLTRLSLRFTSIQSLEPLRNLTQLQDLDISQTSIGDLEPVRGLSAMTHLDLSGTKVQDLESLRGFEALVSLDLSYNKIQSLEPVVKLRSLNEIVLSGAVLRPGEVERFRNNPLVEIVGQPSIKK